MKLNPESQFVPTLDNLATFLSQHGLTLKKFELAKSGIENCTVFVETDKGSYVLRVYRQAKKTQAEIELEIKFVNYLHEQDIPVAAPISNQSGESITQISAKNKKWQAILMPVMSGEHAGTYSPKLIQSLATLQAKMHLLAINFKDSVNTHTDFHDLRESYFINLIKDRSNLEPDRAAFVNRAEAYVVKLDPTLPFGLCHLDYDNGNVLTDNDKITAVLDFDDLAYAPFVMCLAYTIWDVAFDGGMQALQTYLDAYENLRALNDVERKLLLPIVLFRHYVIGCKDIADNAMDETLFSRYAELEADLLTRI